MFCFIVDDRGRVILSSDEEATTNHGGLGVDIGIDRRVSENESLAKTVQRMVIGEEGVSELEIDGKEYYMAYAPIKHTGWSIGAATMKNEAMMPIVMNDESIHMITEANVHTLNSHIQSIITMNIVVAVMAILGMLAIGRGVSRHFVAPIKILSDSACEISEGNLDKKIDIHTGDEIEHLAICFNNMTSSLKKSMDNIKRMSEERERQNIALREKNAELSRALRDVDTLRASKNAYRKESETDRLTGLCNKAATEHICTEICGQLQDGRQAVLYAVDLDHFKNVNDAHGHQYGDKVLVEFALQLKLICRENDCVGRFGGDEFVVMMAGTLTGETIQRKAQAMLQAASNLAIDGIPAGVTASIGVAVAPIHGVDYPTLFKVADKALYYVKEHGRNDFHIGHAL